MLINSDVAALLLNHQNVAIIVTDSAWTIRQVGGNFGHLRWDLEELIIQATPANQIAANQTETSETQEALAMLTKHAEAFLIGAPLALVLPELIGLEAELQAIYTGARPSLRLEFVNREDRDGNVTYLTLTIYGYPFTGDMRSGLICLIEDVTSMGELNQRLTQQHNERYLLHMALERSNLELAAANAELRALDELKSRFVSIAAHELRTPLASVLGYADFLLQDETDQLSNNQRKGIETIQRAARRLLSVSNDLLDVTRIEAGKLELTMQSINLPLLTQALIEVFEPELAQKGHQLTLTVADNLPPALCDEKRVLQILTNLLSNAIKYTPAQGQIQVRLDFNEAEQQLVVAVADNGIGIPPQDLPKIGKSFFRASNVHHARANGAGLGLNITISLVELHGGKFWVESTQGQGTTVFVTFAIAAGL